MNLNELKKALSESAYEQKDPNKENVTEDMYPETAWFAEAAKMDEEGLPGFFERIVHGYNHDYGTACHAVAACALAAAYAACGDPNIGLSGYQAGFVMWDFIRQWIKSGNECGMKLVDYDDMLYPQYAFEYDKTISQSTWDSLQKKAKENLKKNHDACDEVVRHWRKIANGKVPFGYQVVDR